MGTLRKPQRHDDLLNFQLKRLFTIGGAPAVRLCEGTYGLPRLEWRVLAAIVESGPMSPSGLATLTKIDQARLSRAAAGLVEKCLLTRDVVPGDHRRVTLSPTAAGRALYAELFPQLARLNERLMAVLEPDEAGVFEACLHKLTRHARSIEQTGGGVPSRADRRRGGSRKVWESRARSL